MTATTKKIRTHSVKGIRSDFFAKELFLLKFALQFLCEFTDNVGIGMVNHTEKFFIGDGFFKVDCVEIRLLDRRAMIAATDGIGVDTPIKLPCHSVAVKGKRRNAVKDEKLCKEPRSYLDAGTVGSERIICISSLLLQAVGQDFFVCHKYISDWLMPKNNLGYII